MASATLGDTGTIANVPGLEPRRTTTRRRRAVFVCDRCRIKKNRCDGERPVCGACQERGSQCQYSGQKSRASVSQEYVDGLKAKNRALERQLAAARELGGASLPSSYGGDHGMPSPTSTSVVPLPQPGVRDDAAIQTSSLHRVPHLLSPAQSSDSAMPSLDGRHHRQFPYHAPNENLRNHSLQEGPGAAMDATAGQAAGTPRHVNQRAAAASATEGSSEYFGESSTFDFMTKVCSPGENASREPAAAAAYRQAGSRADASLAIPPTRTPFFEGLALSLGDDELFSLPSRFVADQLVDAYFRFTHSLNTYLHEGSFRERYERLWLGSELGGVEATEDNLAWFGLVNLVFTFGSNHTQVINRVSVNHARFFKRAKTLVFSSLFQPGNIDIVQSLLLIGQYLHSAEELEHAWIVIGLAIRLAQGLGLNLDAGNFTSSAVEQEVRKRVWWACFVFDRMLSMKVGRPPTINDDSDITVGLPLPIDDEYIEGTSERPPGQPPTVPSKVEFLTHAIAQVRLVERICKGLYSRGQVDFSENRATNIPKLLARTIELDGDLAAWKRALPAHLRPDSDVPGWHFERQRSTLLMRFLHCRILLHRQVLLIYVTHRCPEGFQREIMYPCIRECIMAAHETVCQVQLLSQRHMLHVWWHNSHNVFTALCVMLAFKMLGPPHKEEVGLHASLDVDQDISLGMALLHEIGNGPQPLAFRYLQSLRKLETRLASLSQQVTRTREAEPYRPQPHHPDGPVPPEGPGRPSDAPVSFPAADANSSGAFGFPLRPSMDEQPTGAFSMSGEDLLEFENMFYNTGWMNLMEG